MRRLGSDLLAGAFRSGRGGGGFGVADLAKVLDDQGDLALVEAATLGWHVTATLSDDVVQAGVGLTLDVGMAKVTEAKFASDGRLAAAVDGVANGTVSFIEAFAGGRGLGDNGRRSEEQDGECGKLHNRVRCTSRRQCWPAR